MGNVIFVFTDECGIYEKIKTKKMLKAHPYYVRSNVIISIDDYNIIEKRLSDLKMSIGIDPHTEIKWSHMGTLIKGRDVGYDIDLSKIQKYFKDVCILIQKCSSAKLFYTITKLSEVKQIDKVKLIKMHMQDVYQRIEMEIGRNDCKAIVIADDLNSENKKLKSALYELTKDGDRFIDYEHIYNGLFIDYSDQCCGLQLADICAGIMTASLKYIESDIDLKHKFSFSYDLFTKYLFEKIRHDDSCLPYYTVYGYGIKEVPNNCGKSIVKKISQVIENALHDDLLKMIN